MRRLKVAMVDPAAYSLPYDTGLCEGLARAGMDVTLYTTRFAHGPMPSADGYQIVEWFYRHRLPGPRRLWRGIQHPLDLNRLLRHLRRRQPDIVHVQWSVMDRIDLRAWRQLDLPTVFTAHNAVPRENQGESISPEKLDGFDAVVAHSRHGARALAAAGLSDVWHIPHGALDRYADAPEPQHPPVVLGPGPVVVLAGLLRPYKGVDSLLEAWPLVRRKIPDAQLVIAGRPMGITLPQDPGPSVHLLPRFVQDDEYAWLLRRADICCLPYRAIDLSGVLFSALALGTPLVLTNVGGFREFEGAGAELVPPEDSDALADALVRVLSHPDRRAQLSAEARAAAAGPYSWDAIARTYVERYATLAGTAAVTSRGPSRA